MRGGSWRKKERRGKGKEEELTGETDGTDAANINDAPVAEARSTEVDGALCRDGEQRPERWRREEGHLHTIQLWFYRHLSDDESRRRWEKE
jgi:hypothetical protein